MPEKYDISGEIDMIVKNVPYNLEPIEIVRWIYLKLGAIFSYNLKILTEYEKSIEPLNYKQNPNIPISRYQTCIQISEIFSTIINNLNIPNLSAKIIPLKLENKAYAQDHKAVEVVYGEEKYLMDLTLDLYLIQNEFQTKHFGFTTDIENTYDIIPISLVKKMDKNIGIEKEKEFFEKKLEKFKLERELKRDYNSYSFEENIKQLLTQMNNSLMVKLNGQHEAIRFFSEALNELLYENVEFRIFNLYYNEETFDFSICFCFTCDGEEPVMYLYDTKTGLIKTDKEKLISMLNSNWKTNSKTLVKQLNNNGKTL